MPVAVALAVVLFSALLAPPSSPAAPPPNDECSAATVITGFDSRDELDTGEATTALDDPLQDCTTGGASTNARSVWYSFTAPSDGRLRVSTLFSDYDTVISVHTGVCGALVPAACNDDFFSAGRAAVSVLVAAGTTYLVDVTGHGASAGGHLDVHLSFVPSNPVCPESAPGGFIDHPKLTLTKLGPPAGDEQLKVSGTLVGAGSDPNPAVNGMQIRIEEEDAAYAPLFELSHMTTPVPGGGVGTACLPKDGWRSSSSLRSFRYLNVSNALPPCLPGSAQGLAVIGLHKRAHGFGDLQFTLKTKGSTIPTPAPGRLRVAVALGSSAAASANGDCAIETLFECALNSSGTSLKCR